MNTTNNIVISDDKKNIDMISKKNRKYIAFLMDETGSMASMGSEPIQGANKFYKTQKDVASENDLEVYSTLAFFSEDVRYKHSNKKIDEVNLIEDGEYIPDGMTALHDSIHDFVNNIRSEIKGMERETDVVLIILTDGLDNSSKKYNHKHTKTLLETLKDEDKWVIIYLGANHDVFTTATNIGVSHRLSGCYDATPLGCNHIFAQLSDNISRCISSDTRTFEGDFKSHNNTSDDWVKVDNVKINSPGGLSHSYSC
jgi:hypothetical protein